MVDHSSQQITVGSWFRVTGFVAGEEEVFRIVFERETDYVKNKIPPASPLACALAGAKAGDKVVFHPPGGEVELTVLEVGSDRPG